MKLSAAPALYLKSERTMQYNITLSDSNTTQNGLCNISNATQQIDSYDGFGAMCFIVATICVYGLGIVLFIAGHISKRQRNKDDEVSVADYMKRIRNVKEEERKKQTMYHMKNIQSRYSVISQDDPSEPDLSVQNHSLSSDKLSESERPPLAYLGKPPDYDETCLSSIKEET